MSANATTVDGLGAPLAQLPGLSARVRARLRAWRLDQELARGVDPRFDAALTLRAARLLRQESRARIADALEEALQDIDQRMRPATKVPLREPGIVAAQAELKGLVAALRADDRCQVRGVALARLLIIDGGSPLYAPGSERELAAAASRAYRALRTGDRG
jgi:hypothetical protein